MYGFFFYLNVEWFVLLFCVDAIFRANVQNDKLKKEIKEKNPEKTFKNKLSIRWIFIDMALFYGGRKVQFKTTDHSRQKHDKDHNRNLKKWSKQ